MLKRFLDGLTVMRCGLDGNGMKVLKSSMTRTNNCNQFLLAGGPTISLASFKQTSQIGRHNFDLISLMI